MRGVFPKLLEFSNFSRKFLQLQVFALCTAGKFDDCYTDFCWPVFEHIIHVIFMADLRTASSLKTSSLQHLMRNEYFHQFFCCLYYRMKFLSTSYSALCYLNSNLSSGVDSKLCYRKELIMIAAVAQFLLRLCLFFLAQSI